MSGVEQGAVVVRPAVEADVPAIAELDGRVFQLVPWSPVMVHEGVEGIVPGLSYLVAEHAATVVSGDRGGRAATVTRFAGYAAVSVVDDVAELQRVAVHEDARRLGIGAALVEATADHARRGGAVRLLLEVHEHNTNAIALYATTGFVEIAQRARYFRDGAAALVLERTL